MIIISITFQDSKLQTNFGQPVLDDLSWPILSNLYKRIQPILHYLRTRRISLPAQITSRSLYDEAEFYNIRQLSSRLKLTARLDEESCGGIHFYENLTTPER